MTKPQQWDTPDDAVRELKERRDDFQSASLRIPVASYKIGSTTVKGPFLEVHLCDGTSKIVGLPIAEALLNDGILSRLRIPVKLIREEQHAPPEPGQ